MGCIEVSDYLDLIVEAGREEEVYGYFLQWLQGPDGARMGRAGPVQSAGCLARPHPLARACPGRGAQRRGVPGGRLPDHHVAPAGEGEDPAGAAWDAYLETLDKKERHEIRRKLRRLEREAPDAEVRYVLGGPEVPAAVDTFIGLHRNSRSDKHAFMTPEMQDYFRAIAQVAADRGWLRLAFLDVGGESVASYFCFDYGDAVTDGGPGCDVLVYNSGYDPASMPQLSPGWVLLAQVIQHAIALGRRHFDFLQGSEDYKHRFGGVDTPVFRTIVRRGGT